VFFFFLQPKFFFFKISEKEPKKSRSKDANQIVPDLA